MTSMTWIYVNVRVEFECSNDWQIIRGLSSQECFQLSVVKWFSFVNQLSNRIHCHSESSLIRVLIRPGDVTKRCNFPSVPCQRWRSSNLKFVKNENLFAFKDTRFSFYFKCISFQGQKRTLYTQKSVEILGSLSTSAKYDNFTRDRFSNFSS